MLVASLLGAMPAHAAAGSTPSVIVTSFASGGLLNPRGLKLTPDGTLYISNVGFGPLAPLRQILRVEITD